MNQSSTDEAVLRRVQLLKNVPLFTNLTELELKKLVKDLHLKSYRANEIIFHQGDLGQEMFIILTGKVRIYKSSPSGEETTLTILSTYDVFGEFAVIDSKPRSATARAVGDADLLAMSKDRFDIHFEELPGLARGVTNLLTHKLRWTAAYAAAVAQYDAAARLLHILLLYYEKFGQKRTDGPGYELDLSLNQMELASVVGARREWVNRLLRDWKKRGLLEYNAGKIIILDLPGVQAERDSRIQAQHPLW